ncbi:homeodomain-interacting protein kinase 3-like [Centropristis striata]|uniref:homeodomain-interacting protein kinase 3-like n=1 Tax=Centropristis striata TaxID=184440 RepID=UPI0027E19DCD|nr:homeodomain-interacting protein kinase 3-like [Centropristis striata]
MAVRDILSSPFGDYLVLSFLGVGSYGKVAKCIKSATQEKVAVKIIRSPITEGQKELAILQQLRLFDPDRFNFIRHGDSFTNKERLCIEFEILDMNLWDFLAKKPLHVLSVKEIRPILHQMATTLQLLRSLGVVHADLKPDNIMMVDHVNQPLKVKMIDFGMASHVSQIECGTYMQPRSYRSPEVILGLPFTTAIDMWSLGCIAAELFLGHLLYPGSTEYNILRQMMQIQGQLPHKLLKDGMKTRCFFRKIKGHRHRWRLKTYVEYGEATGSKGLFNSLDDLKKIRPTCHLSDEDTMAEEEDLDKFVDLLKQMLHLDADKRITPSQLLEDPFITMGDLVDSFPDSFYVKSCCEVMGVCRDQTLSSDNWDQQPQASTSTASLDKYNIPGQVTPAWHTRPEHPLVLGIASDVSSSLSIHEDQGLEMAPPESKSLKTDLIEAQAGKINTFHPCRSPNSYSPKRKVMKMSLVNDSKETPIEALASEAETKPCRKRTRATFEASHSGSRSQNSYSPKRKVMKMSLLIDSKEIPIEASASKAETKPCRKRTQATFEASHSGLRSPNSYSPKRKVMKMSLLNELEETPIEAAASKAETKPCRKRARAIFEASHSGLRSPNSCSPKRKVMKMSLLNELEETPIKALASEAESKPCRKRKLEPFEASHNLHAATQQRRGGL